MKEIKPFIRNLNFQNTTRIIKDVFSKPPEQVYTKLDIFKLPKGITENLTINNIASFGKLFKTTGMMKSHSFTLQFLQGWEVMTAAAAGSLNYCDTVYMRDITNTVRSVTALPTGQSARDVWAAEAPAGIDTYGLLAGTGTTSPTNIDYKAETKIEQGSSSGKFQYQATVVGGAHVVGSNVDLVISRVVVNASGSTITVREIVLYLAAKTGPYTFCVLRDSVNQDVLNGEGAVISYVIRTTV